MNSNEPMVVEIDKEMQDLVPLFINQRKIDIAALEQAAAANDHEAVRKIGHSLAGARASYGFQRVSDIGEALEVAAKARNDAEVAKEAGELKDYMRRVVVKYV